VQGENVKKAIIIIVVILVIIAMLVGWVIGRYNKMQRANIDVQTQWAQVQNIYQTRFDLVPNLVSTVQGAANFEKSTLTAVVQARSQMGGVVQMPKEAINDPAAFAKMQAAQDGLGSALQRLMVVVEKYPDLKANQNFLALQEQLESLENRIRQERRLYNESAGGFNKLIIAFPNNVLAGMFNIKSAELFKAEQQAQKAPAVKFE
jgi:LemA protein